MNNHNLDELKEFARQFQTDKLELGYLPLYLEYFKRQGIERDAPLKILEIGTNKGSSLRTWAEYFPNAEVHGIDITTCYEIAHLLKHDRIFTTIADQGNRKELLRAIDEFGIGIFDIIVDDGSHDQAHQQISLGALFPFVRKGGLYVVEDLITGQPFMDGNTWNKSKITPTRNILQIFEQTGRLLSPVMEDEEIKHIKHTYRYCEYRESSAIIYDQWHPEVVFIGKNDD
jgi:predicted O-methyltransferase YrrM